MSVEVARGFSEVMVTVREYRYLVCALLIIGSYVFLHLKFARKSLKEGELAIPLMGLVVLFFAFKHGFVRQDHGHQINFFGVAPIIVGFLWLFQKSENTTMYKKLFLFFVITSILSIISCVDIYGIYAWRIEGPSGNIFRIMNFKSIRENHFSKKYEKLTVNVLPEDWNQRIGTNTIQILPWELTYAIANNWQAWRPNPVLQLYSIYTRKLDEYSAASFLPDTIPHFVLLEYGAIDGRNMFLDTPMTWNNIVPNYHVVKHDDRRALIKKNDQYSTLSLVPLTTQKVNNGEWINLPIQNNLTYGKFTIRPSFVGKLVTSVFRNNPPTITVKDKKGKSFKYRIIPDNLRNPALLNIIPANFSQTLNFFKKTVDESSLITSFKIDFDPVYYSGDVKVKWFSGSPLKDYIVPR
jgi:hypothetical protein